MAAESQLEKYLVKRVKASGGQIRKVKFVNRKGCPDRLVLFPGGRVFFIELKAPGKPLKDHQKREFRRLRKLGLIAYKMDIADDVEDFISDILK